MRAVSVKTRVGEQGGVTKKPRSVFHKMCSGRRAAEAPVGKARRDRKSLPNENRCI